MDALECLRSRMSIRKFRPEPVPEAVLTEIINTARWSPSYKNSQPWSVVLVSGRKKDELSQMLLSLLEQGADPDPDFPVPLSWPEPQRQRIDDLMRSRREAFGIDLDDPEVKKRSKAANFQFYGAPHGMFLLQDASLTEWSVLDIGMFAQSLMLAAHALGLGTVPQAFLADYAGEIKKFLGIAETQRLVLGMSIGYPDLSSRANSFRTSRAEVTEILRTVE